ncbi:MAG TPA: PEP-CTERM sorting domain-containing protein [Pirellulales bacterium]|jgi:hypothetical protein|nr:PEP-CTERM sorting domain-containing protein [Pirellulales bacterium]
MSRVFILGFAALICVTTAQLASASLIAYDSFSYTAGAGGLANQNGDTGWSTTWGGGTNNVVSPGLTFTSNGNTLATAGNSAETAGGNIGNFRTLSTAMNSGTVYISLLAKFDSGTVGSSYAGVSLFSAGGEKQFIGQPNVNSFWGLDGASGHTLTTVPVDGTTHLFVFEINYGAGAGGSDLVSLFVDPTPGLAAPDVGAAITANASPEAFDTLRIQAGGDEKIAFDEIRVATDYASAVPLAAPVPEPATLTLAALGLIGLLAVRRR